VLSLLCFREFAGATGLCREKLMSLMVVVCILGLTFAVADHWYRLFVALTPMSIVVFTAVATSLDRPKGYIQRVALSIFGFILFGTCLGHLSYMSNDTHYRSLVLLLIFCVQLDDVFAYIVGKSMGGPKLAPETSPTKTVAGSLGAVVLTTALVFGLSGLVFREGLLAEPLQRLVLGLVISIAGQMGDLTVSAIKRDVGIKDTGSLIPGHGGVLDRANSLLLAAPAMFHFVNHFRLIGLDQATNLLSGGG
jgi:phosphatidate cytidylyltransferase